MQVCWPEFKLRQRRRQVEVLWVGQLQPSPLSAVYSVSILLQRGWCPAVRVLSPMLAPRSGCDKLPHVNSDGSLCLHVDGEWNSGMFVADTTVPWASTWLYFYEIWHATGLWLGGGTHPDRPEHRSTLAS